MVRIMTSGEAAAGGRRAFFASHGLAISRRYSRFSSRTDSTIMSGMPHVDREVADGETLRWGTSEWIALETNGHAEGHLCLSNAAAGLLISGDQVLPSISSNISYGFHIDDANPLGSFLDSLERLRTLPEETLVLPSHGGRFTGCTSASTTCAGITTSSSTSW